MIAAKGTIDSDVGELGEGEPLDLVSRKSEKDDRRERGVGRDRHKEKKLQPERRRREAEAAAP